MDALVRTRVLRTLGQEIGHAHARQFARRYLEMLDRRLVHLSRALERADAERALTVSLGLATASAMVGAGALSEQAGAIVPALRAGDVAPARAALPQIRMLAVGTAEALAAELRAPRERVAPRTLGHARA
ncbi:hypothetical protein [Georgenia subflava]|uniref:HPt domain-containing protein n=1 Tax=Georgenia subflava TaxID=1622177 RepID=A0A6N7EN62_9MICO|nr:hypothetical protein [Georgenia subflava]MPV37975.1 hypothetical protein [Georgenia subflava]